MAVCVPVVISVASKQHRLHVHLLLKQDSGVVLTYRPAHSCTLKMVQQAKDRRVEFHVQSPEHRLYKTPSREACTLTDVIFAMCEILMALYPLESNNGLPGTPATALLQLQRECLQKFYVPVSSWAPLPAYKSKVCVTTVTENDRTSQGLKLHAEWPLREQFSFLQGSTELCPRDQVWQRIQNSGVGSSLQALRVSKHRSML